MGGATFAEMSPGCLRKVSEQAREGKSVAVSIHNLSSYYGFSCQQIVTCKMTIPTGCFGHDIYHRNKETDQNTWESHMGSQRRGPFTSQIITDFSDNKSYLVKINPSCRGNLFSALTIKYRKVELQSKNSGTHQCW